MRWWLLNRYFPDWGPFFLRLALGTVFMANGWEKLQGPLGTPEGFNIETWGWPYPLFWAWAVAIVEFFGGLAVVVGLFTRFAALFIAGVMAMAIVQIRVNEGFIDGLEFEFTLLMVALCLVVTGGGRFSVDYEILGWGAPPRRRADLEEIEP
jgi:putative oxidoreductase